MKTKDQVVLQIGHIQLLLPRTSQLGNIVSFLSQGVEVSYYRYVNDGNIEVGAPVNISIIQIPPGTKFVMPREAEPQPEVRRSKTPRALTPGTLRLMPSE